MISHDCIQELRARSAEFRRLGVRHLTLQYDEESVLIAAIDDMGRRRMTMCDLWLIGERVGEVVDDDGIVVMPREWAEPPAAPDLVWHVF